MSSTEFTYDLIVLGAGSAGVRAARFSAGFGARVAVIEEHLPGGTCVIRGCVPKKLMVYASEFFDEMRASSGFGFSGEEFHFDWKKFKDRRDAEISRLSGIYQNLLKKNNVAFFEGSAQIVGPHEVKVNGEILKAQKILIAVGGWPTIPDIPGKEYAWTSNDIFEADERPESALIVGTGFIAVEFAGILQGLGSSCELLGRSSFLRGFDSDCTSFLRQEYEKRGIRVTLGDEVQKIEKSERGFIAHLNKGEKREVARVIFATGRHPKTLELGLDEVGVTRNKKGAIEVNGHFQTSVPSIYALGDCIDKVNLTPVALMQASLWARENFNHEVKKTALMSYENLPVAVFGQPELSYVGLSEEECAQKGIEVEVYEANFKALKHTLSGLDKRTYMKMIVARDSQRVLGLHMVGESAAEIIQLGAVALKAGATKEHFDQTIGIHPTSAEEFVTMRTPRDKQK